MCAFVLLGLFLGPLRLENRLCTLNSPVNDLKRASQIKHSNLCSTVYQGKRNGTNLQMFLYRKSDFGEKSNEILHLMVLGKKIAQFQGQIERVFLCVSFEKI